MGLDKVDKTTDAIEPQASLQDSISKQFKEDEFKNSKEEIKKTTERPFFGKLLRSICYFFGFATVGYYYSITSVTLPLLKLNSSSTDSIIGLCITFRGFGLLSSAMITGFLYKYINRTIEPENNHSSKTKKFLFILKKLFFQLVHLHSCINFFAFVIVIMLFLIPFTTNIYLLFIFHYMIGFANSFIEIGCVCGINQVMKEKAGAFQNIMLGFFGVGNLFFPLLVGFFYEFIEQWKTQLAISYFVCATMTYIPSFLIFCITDPSREPPKQKIMDNTKREEEKEKKKPISNSSFLKNFFSLRSLVILCTAILKFLFLGLQIGFTGLLFTYCKRLSLDTDANLSFFISIFYVFFTVSRFLTGFLSFFIKPSILLFIYLPACIFAMVLILIFPNSLVVVWIGSLIFSIFASPGSVLIYNIPQSNFGITLSEVETSFVICLQYFGGTLGSGVMTLISDDKILGPIGIILTSLIFTIVTFICFCITIFFGYLYYYFDPEAKKKRQTEKDKKEKKKLNMDHTKESSKSKEENVEKEEKENSEICKKRENAQKENEQEEKKENEKEEGKEIEMVEN